MSTKKRYLAEKTSCNMLKLGVRFGFVSDWLYLGLYYYKTHRYEEALSVVDKTKAKLSEPFLMYHWDGNEAEYAWAVGGKSYFEKTKWAVAVIISLQQNIRYIDEFKLNEVSEISPYVLNLMLEVLCCIQIDPMRAIAVGKELQSFVINDNEEIRDTELRKSAMIILAICNNRLNYCRIQSRIERKEESANSFYSLVLHRIFAVIFHIICCLCFGIAR